MGKFEELLGNVRKATGPNRKLDLEIARALTQDVIVLKHQPYTGLNEPFTYWEYTGKIDDALALMERVLPGIDFSIGRMEEGDPENWYDVIVGTSFAQHRLAPLAILEAMLTELELAE